MFFRKWQFRRRIKQDPYSVLFTYVRLSDGNIGIIQSVTVGLKETTIMVILPIHHWNDNYIRQVDIGTVEPV